MEGMGREMKAACRRAGDGAVCGAHEEGEKTDLLATLRKNHCSSSQRTISLSHSLCVCVSDLLFFFNKSSAHLTLIKNFPEERKVFMLPLHIGTAPADTALCRILFMMYLWKNISTGVIRYVSCVRLSESLWG